MKDLFGNEIPDTTKKKVVKIHAAKKHGKVKETIDYSKMGLNANWRNFATDNIRSNKTPTDEQIKEILS